MRKRLVIALSIACVIAAVGIVLMCLDRDTEVRTADNKAAASSDALKIDSEPEFKEYSDIADPYERAAKIKADNSDIASDGYVISLKESAGDDVVAAIDKAISNGAQIKALEYTDRTYTCSSLEEFSAVVDGSYVETAEPDFEVKLLEDEGDVDTTAATPNDTFYNSQYNIKKMNVPAVWDRGFEGQDTDLDVDADSDSDKNDDMIVAVIDSGLYEGHDDIDKSRIEQGKTFVYGTSDTGDTGGHGTFVSGIIAATKNNRKGMAGLLQGVKIMPLRVFGESGSTSMSTVTEAVNYAVEQKAGGRNIAVINMSLGGSGRSTPLKIACKSAMDSGIIVVCAAGNDYEDGHEPSYPAQYTMGVGSLNEDLDVSSFSQRWDSSKDGEGAERKVWVTAPGEDIYGPYHLANNKYRIGSGTSFACPEVAALAAICKSINNDINQDTFMQLLKETAVPSTDRETKIQDTAYGWGRVDFERTVNSLTTNDTIVKSSVTVRVVNKTGSVISNASVTFRRKADSSVVQPSDGKWLLNKGVTYELTVSANGYETKTVDAVQTLDTVEIEITLEGAAKYPVSLNVKDTNGDEVSPDLYTASVVRVGESEEIQADSDGKFRLNVGAYKIKISSDQYYLYSEPEFFVDDMQENLSGGKTIDVVLRRDAIGLSWKDHSGTETLRTEALGDIEASNVCMEYTIRDSASNVYAVRGISLADLFELVMSPDQDERIVSVRIDGKRAKRVVNGAEEASEEVKATADAVSEPAEAASDVTDEKAAEEVPEEAAEEATEEPADAEHPAEAEPSEESAEAVMYDLEDASVMLDASDLENAIIAIDHDDEIMKDYNSMRLVIDGRDTADWLYAPSLITVETKLSIDDCEISGIKEKTYTGSAITQSLEVKYNDKTLTEGEDYTVSYQNNVNPGRASLIIKGSGGFTGSKTVYFNIAEPPHQHSYVSSVAREATEDAEGLMRHYCTGCGDTYYTAIARIVYPTDRPSVKISKPKAAKKKMTVRWKKVSKKNRKKIDGIEIQVSGPGYYRTFTAGKGKTSKKISGLAREQKYSVRVRTYKYIDGVKHVSKWSGWKTAKIK